MHISRYFAPLMLAPLAACGPGPDVADNIPAMGQWSDESKVVSVLVNGAAVSLDDIPELQDIKKLNRPMAQFCGEPYFRTKQEFEEELGRHGDAKCSIESVDNEGSKVSAKGRCEVLGGTSINTIAGISATAFQRPDNISLKADINIVVRSNETGEGNAVQVVVRRKMKRLGDC